MRVLSSLLLSPLIATATLTLVLPEARAATPIVVVYDIEDKGADLDAGLRDRLTEYLASSLAATGAYQVVPRSQLKQRLQQAKRESHKRCYDQSCQVAIGRELAANKSLSTQLIKLGELCMVTAVMYDLRKSASEGGARAEGACDEAAVVSSIKTVIARLVPSKRPPPAVPPVPAAPATTAGPTVSVDIASEPAGAEIFVDGRARGVTPARLELPKGRGFELGLEKKGYAPLRERLRVDGRVSRSFRLALTAEGRRALRTRTEWIAGEWTGGALFDSAEQGTDASVGGMLRLFTLKWRWVFWSIIEAGFGGGEEFAYGWFSTRLGVPFYLDVEGTHQLRVGVGVGGGSMGGHGDGGLLLSPTAHYHYQGRSFFIGVGLRMMLPVVGDFQYSTYENSDTSYHSYYPVAVMLSVPFGWISSPD